jgi:hypothetical protein
MAKPRKPLDQLSPAYRRRIEREIARAQREGRPEDRKRARGKPQNEAAVRRERKVNPAPPTLTGDITPAQKGQIRRLAREQAGRSLALDDEDDIEEFYQAGLNYARLNGYAAFMAVRDRAHGLRAEYLAEKAAGIYVQRPGLLSVFATEFGIDDVRWFYYH